VAVAPATAIPSAQEASVGELSPTPAEYQAGVDRQSADLSSPHWRALVPHSTQSVVWTPVYDNPAAGGPTVTLATETVSSNGIPFWVGANITVKNLVSTFLSGAPGHAEGGYAFLVSSDGPVGTVLSYSPGGAADLGFGPKKSRAAAVNLTSQDSPWLAVGNNMTLGLSGHGTINLEGAPVSVFYSPLPASQWSLGVAVPVSGIDGSVVGFSQTITHGLVGVTALLLPFLIILAALVVVLTDLLSRRLLLPLSNLTGASRRIAGGDLETPVAVAPGPQDEVGTLEMALEGMRKRLAGQHQIIEAAQRNLEQRVEERTSELRQRNDELATLNSVSADLSRSLVLSDVATGAADQLRQLWRVREVSVYLVDQTAPVGVRLVGRSMDGDAGDDHGPELSNALAMSDQSPATPLQVDDLVVVPLQVTGTKVGYLVLRQAQLPGRRQIEMLEVVGGQLALALRNAQLFADTQEMATINERNRIAREIHDTIAQGLAGIIIQLQAAEAWMEREPKRSQQALGHASALARSSLQEARRSVWDLRPELLERGGLASALKEELAQAQARTGVKTSVKLRGLRQLTLPAATEVSIFRIVQEAVSNSLHHARPASLAVEVARDDGHLRVEIADDGCGFDPGRPGRLQAFGLTSMRERATSCGGSFSLNSTPGKGTRVVLEIPIPEPVSAKPLR
jgi:signal transduction histidine kinase